MPALCGGCPSVCSPAHLWRSSSHTLRRRGPREDSSVSSLSDETADTPKSVLDRAAPKKRAGVTALAAGKRHRSAMGTPAAATAPLQPVTAMRARSGLAPPDAAGPSGRQAWSRLADRHSVVSLPAFFGVQADAFADFPERAAVPLAPVPVAGPWLEVLPTAPRRTAALGTRAMLASAAEPTEAGGGGVSLVPADKELIVGLEAEQASFAFMRSLCGDSEDSMVDELPSGLGGLVAFPGWDMGS